MATRKSAPLDAMVGARIRMLRIDRGISQTALAARLGVTFQQVQDYEQGAGRVGAVRLARIASVLDVSVGAFFESSPIRPPGSRSPGLSPGFLFADPEARQAREAYARKPGPERRAHFAKLAETTTGRGSTTSTTIARLNTADPDPQPNCPCQG